MSKSVRQGCASRCDQGAGDACGRRRFLADAAGVVIAAGLGACGGSGEPVVTGPQTLISFAQYPKLATVGGSVVTEVSSHGKTLLLLVARTGAGMAVALSASCTHTGCAVAYNHAASNLQCPCHGSQYSLSGEVTQGPAPLPLARYSAAVSADGINVSLPG